MKTTKSRFRLFALVTGTALAAVTASIGVTAGTAQPAAATTNPPDQSQRAEYHLTAPDNWLSDPQRPIYADGKYNLYYLYSDPDNSPGGWRHATTTDNVVFDDKGIAIPLTGTDFPVWTGSGVVDTNNTAGFGAGAIIVLATQPTDGDAYQQEQYLWYSTDGGSTFTAYGSPVITNPDGSNWFRDPKIAWDSANSEWVAVIGRSQELSFYTSTDLKSWTHQSDLSYTSPNIGGFECPDLFQIKADDGTTHWVLAASTQGDYSGQPDTYGYWTGTWNGTSFVRDQSAPQWLDYGWDWYAAVTYPDQDSPLDTRYAIGWMNNWHYAASSKPTDATDGYNGQMSIVRQIQLAKQSDGTYSLLSQPVSSLDDIVTKTVHPADVTVNGSTDLDYHGSAYELDADVSWSSLSNVGISVGESADKSRHTNIGVYGGNVYVDRLLSDQSGYAFGSSFHQSESPLGSSAKSVHLKILVDHDSVEVFVNDGKTVQSNQVYFEPGDTGISLYTDGGSALFSNMSIEEFANVSTVADPATPYANFEASNYGSWTTTGTAFGSGPAAGTLPTQQTVSGYQGSKLVDSYLSGDSTTGTLTSPSFTVSHPFVNFLVGGGDNPKPSDLFAGFEGSTFGTGWTATGSFLGRARARTACPDRWDRRRSTPTSAAVTARREPSRRRPSRSPATTSTSCSRVVIIRGARRETPR
jgi:sucrose-6-phosphate hydrolase SacC (GH32 family)